MKLDAHAEGVDQDAKEDELLEEMVVHELLNVLAEFGDATGAAADHRVESNQLGLYFISSDSLISCTIMHVKTSV